MSTRHPLASRSLLAGLDIGGTKSEAWLFGAGRAVLGRGRCPTPTTSPTALVEAAVSALDQALAEAGASRAHLGAVGVGVPGQVESETGTVSLAANLPLVDFPLGAALAHTLGVPTTVENDVRAAAWGCYTQGAGDNLAYLNIGTGISAGLILEGRLYRGPRGMAGEIGHMVVEPGGPRCNCGARGCLEALVAGPALAHAIVVAMQNNRGNGSGLPSLSPLSLFPAAQAGDPIALEIVERVGGYLGRALQALVMAYDVEHIILGGGVTRAGDAFLAPILREWERLRADSPLFRALLNPDALTLADPAMSMVALGAAALTRTFDRATTPKPLSFFT